LGSHTDRVENKRKQKKEKNRVSKKKRAHTEYLESGFPSLDNNQVRTIINHNKDLYLSDSIVRAREE
jgi:hypothetical protein